MTRPFPLLLTAFLCAIACQAPDHSAAPAPLTFDANSVIHDGVGVDTLQFGQLKRADLKRIIKAPHDSIIYNTYSVAIHYPSFGVSFYYQQKDTNQTIFAMEFDTAFKGKTQRGFRIGAMTVADMIHLYGEPTYQTLTDDPMLYAHFDSAGIYFEVPLRKGKGAEFEYKSSSTSDGDDDDDEEGADSVYNAAERKFYDSAYRSSKIRAISIGTPGTSF